mmetsp:Transcript_7937/g.15446  ORF Transcript_7937/g.15446 Transcript_7937/m.15446 type:complete len:556 (-) Transcript_7937:587-2254(-)|eukprot:CAMPEP_0175051254 /NCGR_PEP_ID=MMETSP0052_2-20121109/7691_1 /TAXON_ID=51329 ORGANISM="Polytomella parva, Strain SAG 63-3" /NCGR_SAMPLE_ID=MMETSP0052_2 /ASSEMBLY_ACC=CAM_ASM_000194 /LENGTH=555 /DNA_ID=CAMNT_0016315505 /DNA_START=91 /DNA_END=1758 /DNA_ORIENTATION=+
MARLFAKLKSVDFYKKLPSDLVEATLAGAWLSIIAAFIMVTLLFAEFSSFMSVQTKEQLVIDRSPSDEHLKVNFNISFPALSCEFASLDVSDALGTKRINLTKTLRKVPIYSNLQRAGAATEEDGLTTRDGPRYDLNHTISTSSSTSTGSNNSTVNGSLSDTNGSSDATVTSFLTAATFESTLNQFPIVVINFFAPWCHWCQLLGPSWETAAAVVRTKYPSDTDGRILYAKIDCTQEQLLCRSHFIQGFPSIRVFRKGHDDVTTPQGFRDHETYMGDRTVASLTQFADSLVPSAGLPHHRHVHLTAAPRAAGCNVAGFAMVKKVPGTLHFTARGSGYSFDHDDLNLTHVVHAFHLGSKPSARKLQRMKLLHPAGLDPDWADKLHDRVFASAVPQTTHEHYLQVVLTTVVDQGAEDGYHRSMRLAQKRSGRAGGGKAGGGVRSISDEAAEAEEAALMTGGRGKGAASSSSTAGWYDAYEYTARSHQYLADSIPAAKFTMDPSPIQILVTEQKRRWYKFLTTTCAVVGGVFTTAGIVDAIIYSSIRVIKKTQLGKQG